jgi:hypothetical protein
VNRLKRHMSVANVLSCLALFVALGGVAYAAKTLGKNQVKAKNIAKEAVTSPKLKRGAVTSAKLANGAVINAKLANGAVTGAKLANEAVGSGKLAKNAVTVNKIGPESVTTGKLGNESVTGGKLSVSLSSQLLKNVTYVAENSAVDSTSPKSVNATCPAGKEVLGGGVRINGDTEAKVVPIDSGPLLSAANGRVGWTAAAREVEGGTPLSWSVTAFAICAEL